MASRSVLRRASKGHASGASNRSPDLDKVMGAARAAATKAGVDAKNVKLTGDEWGRWHIAAQGYSNTRLSFLGQGRWLASFGDGPSRAARLVDTTTAVDAAREMFDREGRATGSIRGKVKARFHGRWTDDGGKSAPHLDGPLQLESDSVSVKVHADVDVEPESVHEIIDAPAFEVLESTGSAAGSRRRRSSSRGRAGGRSEGPWQPASGGTEPVFVARSGKRLQYMFQPSTGRHGYLDVDSDIILSDDEAMAHLEGRKPSGR